jgi:hypothetical protein
LRSYGPAASAKALGPATRNAREEVKSSIWLTIGVSTIYAKTRRDDLSADARRTVMGLVARLKEAYGH